MDPEYAVAIETVADLMFDAVLHIEDEVKTYIRDNQS